MQDWADATARLRERGLLARSAAPLLTETGRALLTGIETCTDDAAWRSVRRSYLGGTPLGSGEQPDRAL
jgi:Helix-turn-helix family